MKCIPPVCGGIEKCEDGYLLALTNRQRLVFDFPRETEACRFSLGYRVGPRPYCQAYFFLSRHGVSQKFPAISKAILKCVPQQPKLRHFECELEIPAGTHSTAVKRMAAGGGLSQYRAPASAAIAHLWPYA